MTMYVKVIDNPAASPGLINYGGEFFVPFGGGGGVGTVTSVSIVSTNGLAGTVANATTTPAISLSTTITGVLKGNGTAISAATAGTDYTALAFKTLSVSGQSDIVADSPADTLTFAAGSNITITTNAGTDTITIAATDTIGATTALDNLSAVAINAALVLGTSDAFALGSATKQWSDLFLAEGGIINWDNGDATLTQTDNTVTLAGADLSITNTSLLMGSATAYPVSTIPFTPIAQIQGVDAATSSLMLSKWLTANSGGPNLVLAKSRGTIGAYDVVSNGDTLGSIGFYGADGDQFIRAAAILSIVDGTPGNNDMPGNITFSTVADGGTTLIDRVVIDSSGAMKPAANDGLSLGTTALKFSDLFLASGAVINWNSGNMTLTHSAGVLTIVGGNLVTPSLTIGSLTGPLRADSGVVSVDSNLSVIVTKQSLTAKNADIADTTITGTAGLYRISYELLDTTADLTAGAVTLNIKFTDDAAARTISSTPVALTAVTQFTQGVVIARLNSGNITFGVTHSGIFGTATYALYLTAERLI